MEVIVDRILVASVCSQLGVWLFKWREAAVTPGGAILVKGTALRISLPAANLSSASCLAV